MWEETIFLIYLHLALYIPCMLKKFRPNYPLPVFYLSPIHPPSLGVVLELTGRTVIKFPRHDICMSWGRGEGARSNDLSTQGM